MARCRNRPPDLEGNKRGQGEYLPFCGGLFFVTRELFARAGGYDERFSGWGGRTTHFPSSSHASAGDWASTRNVPATTSGTSAAPSATHASYRANVDRLTFLQECTDAQLQQICDADAAEMGDPRAPIQGP